MLLTTIVISRPNASIIQSKNEPSPSPYPNIVIGDLFHECGYKAGAICGDEIFQYVFVNATIVSQECCTKLLKMGKQCHDLLTNATLESQDFDQVVVPHIWTKNIQVWNLCEIHGRIG